MDQCNPDYKDAVWALYRYVPSKVVPIIFAALFGVTTIIHIIQMARTKTWYLTALVVGGTCECIGYIGRLINAQQDAGCWTLGPYIMQNVLILVAPAFMAASIYMILGRIILLTEGEHHALIKRRWLTKFFVAGDVSSLLLQASGGGLMGAGADLVDIGENMIIAGLFVQLAFFGSFVVVSALFHWRMMKAPTRKSADPLVRWQFYLITLYVTSILILTRSIFRVIEYIEGNHGYLMTTEVFVFVFDGILMLLVLLWMNWFHPGEIGILLRGGEPPKNGFELVMMNRNKYVEKVESLSSDREHAPRYDVPYSGVEGTQVHRAADKGSIV